MSRIDELLNLAGSFNTLIDVGCDHGYLGITALEKTTAKVVFSDISEKCLMKARQNIPSWLSSRASFVVCDGVPNIDTDVAIIAGMGGLNIIDILKSVKSRVKKYILQPMKNIDKLREYIYTHFEVIYDDIIIDNGRYYTVIVANNMPYNIKLNDEILYFGAFGQPLSDNKRKFLLYKRNILKKSIAFNNESVLQLNCIDRLLDESQEGNV